ncbi:MAG: S9 family peptidase [Muribaculaceae bacterium]|nr:S9 family peptidase [Muribaculaceae bacterium]
MNRFFTSLSLLAAAAIATATPAASTSTARVMTDMAPFVYPQNAAPTPARPAFTNSPDGLTYLRLNKDRKKIVSCSLTDGKELETVMDITTTRENTLPSSIEEFALSPDGTKILVATDKEPLYRRSFTARYWVYEIRSRILRPLSETHKTQRSPIFSPDGRMVAFTAPDNNIYIKKIDFDTEVAVTTDGAPGTVINGVPDWVYEEEFATDCSMAWAPDAQTLCYLKYNEKAVPSFSFTLYEGTCNPRPEYTLYPGSFSYKYPVAGQPNSVVSLHSYDVDNRKIKDLSLPDRNIEYIPRIEYGGESTDRLMTVTLNRDQTRMEIYSVNPRSGVSKLVFTESTEAWLPTATYEDLTFEKDGFVVLSARTGWQHAYVYSYAGILERTLTSGEYDVTAYYGADLRGNRYVQTSQTGSINRVVTRIDAKGLAKDLTPAEGWGEAWFNPSLTHACLIHSTSATPPVATLIDTKSGKKITTLEESAAIAARYASAPKRQFTTIPAANGQPMNAYIIKPDAFDPSRRYPVILYQYSGPGSQEVTNRWKTDWTQYAAMKGYVVVCVDTRGTGARGRDWETAVYRQLGRLETADLRAAASWIAAQSYADPSRIGITGWSYGGYETLMAITADSDTPSPFAAAVAIAPVTDWRFYDTVYAERYMLTPAQNPDGYASSAPLTYGGRLDIPLLIIHGTADDNVHLMNTIQYVSVVESEGQLCDMLLYPNMNHSIRECDARLSVYSKMLRYFDLNL